MERQEELRLDTGNRFNVFKVGERTFQIGNINFYDKQFFHSIIKLFDYGQKFIPYYFLDSFYTLKDMIIDIDREMLNFNSQIFFKDILIAKNKDLTETYNYSLSSFESLERSLVSRVNKNIPILTESLEFKIEIMSQISEISYNNFRNVSFSEFKSISKFQKEKPFKVVELDKNVGMAMISNSLYDDLVMEHLNDISTYKLIDTNPLEDTIKIVNNSLENLLINKNISHKLFKMLEVNNAKLGNLRLLPKIHKDKFGIRPIISYKDNPTNKLCILLDHIIRPFVVNSPSYIKDSQNLIQITKNKKFPLNAKLFTFDVVSLYTNILHDKCLETLTKFFEKNLDKLDPELGITINGFRELLKLVLDNNYFVYDNKYFQQVKGIAMGSVAGPSIANLYVHCLESEWIESNDPLFYKRYIDDIFYIDLNDTRIESLKKAFGNLELNMSTGDSVEFLDLTISMDKSNGSLHFKPFFKKTNTFSYVLTKSNHPIHVFKNVPKSLFIRLRRICSCTSDFCFFSLKLISHLVSRGYNSKNLLKIFNMVLYLDRDQLLEYKDKNIKQKNLNIIFFKNYFNSNILNLKTCMKNAFSFFKNKNDKLKRFKDLEIQIINKMNFNIGALFIHDFKIKKVYKNFFKRCNDFKCNTCLFFSSDHFIEIKDEYLFPIFDNSNCNTLNCVYIITCKLCNFVFYIGQTNCIHNRIYNHIRDIINFKKFSNNMDKCIAKHFNLLNHNYKQHMVCFIIVKDIEPLEKRLMYEGFFINLFKRLNIKLLNEKIPRLYSYNEKSI